MKRLAILATLMMTLLLNSCLYHPSFSQGNELNANKISKIKNGLTSDQVVAILGSPVLENMYYNNHLIYVYTFKPSHQAMKKYHVIVTFVHHRVVNVLSDFPRT